MKEKVYEPSLEKEVVKAFRENAVSVAIAGVLPPDVSRLKAAPLFDQDRVKRLMDGAIDTHVHSAPDPYMARMGDQID